MSQNISIEITNGTLLLDAATLKAAHIGRKARIVVNQNSIEVLSEEINTDTTAVEQTFGLISLPDDIARELVEGKDLEYFVRENLHTHEDDPVARSFGMIKGSRKLGRKIALSK